MATEIERRFLVLELPDLSGIQPDHLVQGYLSLDPDHTTRIRQVNGQDGFLTIKGRKIAGSGAEFEYPIPAADILGLQAMCGQMCLSKDRYVIEGGDWAKWEVDVFTGRHTGLVIAEIEMPDINADFVRPDWLGPEITEDVRFSNANLVQNDFSEIRKWIAEYAGEAPMTPKLPML